MLQLPSEDSRLSLQRAGYDPGCSPSHLRKGERCTNSQRWPDWQAMSEPPPGPWLALGILTAPSREMRIRATFNELMRHEVAWRFVVAAGMGRQAASDEEVLTVPCPDGEELKQVACFCKTTWWFRRALDLFPSSVFIGKLEDDTVVHVGRLLAELRWAVRSTRAGAMVWYGHFQWAAHRRRALEPSSERMNRHFAQTGISRRDGLSGMWCADGDQLLNALSPKQCKGGWPDATVAPFASGAIDVRSRSLAAHTDRCESLWRREWEGAACDGQQGYFLGDCPPTEELSLMHLHTLKVPHAPTHPVRAATATQRVCARAFGVAVDWRGAWPTRSVRLLGLPKRGRRVDGTPTLWQMRTWKTMKNTPTVHSTAIHGVKRYNRTIDWRPASPALAPLHYQLKFETHGNRTHGKWSPAQPALVEHFRARCMQKLCFNQRVCRDSPVMCF